MTTKTPALRDLTPTGRLNEVVIHAIVGYQLAQAAIVTTHSFTQQVGKGFELRPVEFTILALVHGNPGVSARQLASALAVTPPNITMWIDKLERRDLIERERSSTDRRAQHIRATAQGAALARKAIAHAIEGEDAALAAALSDAERAILIELLHKVAMCRRR
ncbi:MAG: MarR family transcriptional regulator [Burkholderiaceae bacterium]